MSPDTLVTWGMLALILARLEDGAVGGMWFLVAMAAFTGSAVVGRTWRRKP